MDGRRFGSLDVDAYLLLDESVVRLERKNHSA